MAVRFAHEELPRSLSALEHGMKGFQRDRVGNGTSSFSVRVVVEPAPKHHSHSPLTNHLPHNHFSPLDIHM